MKTETNQSKSGISNKQKVTVERCVLRMILPLLMITGCSEVEIPVTPMQRSSNTRPQEVPDFKDITFELGQDLIPFGEVEIKADDFAASYIASVTIVSASGSETSESADFCKVVSIESDSPAEKKYSDCSTGEVKAQSVIIRNTGKQRLYLIAFVHAKTLSGIWNGK